jgi:hypothetical protein
MGARAPQATTDLAGLPFAGRPLELCMADCYAAP